MSRKIAFWIYLLSAVILMFFALVYLVRSEFLPYHAQVVGQDWLSIAERTRLLILSLIHFSGGIMASLSLALGVLVLVPFRKNQGWADWAVPLVSFTCILPTFGVTFYLHLKTQAATPWLISLILLALNLLAAAFTFMAPKASLSKTAAA